LTQKSDAKLSASPSQASCSPAASQAKMADKTNGANFRAITNHKISRKFAIFELKLSLKMVLWVLKNLNVPKLFERNATK
jgi:hypothetical protein